MVMCSSPTKMTDTQQQKTRRSNKPLMERRRRERINQCLNQLKTLVLTAQRKDPTRYSKLEKADILEMTVRHVQSLQRQESGRGDKYRAGFTQCAAEVAKFLAGMSGLPADLHCRVLTHLTAHATHHPPIPTPEQLSLKSESSGAKIKTLTVSIEPATAKMEGVSAPCEPRGSSPDSVLGEGLVALVLPEWGVSAGGSSPTTPEAAGAPSSPESARGSSPSALTTLLGHTSPPLAAPQLAPLDLATPHRRSVGMAINTSHTLASLPVSAPPAAASDHCGLTVSASDHSALTVSSSGPSVRAVGESRLHLVSAGHSHLHPVSVGNSNCHPLSASQPSPHTVSAEYLSFHSAPVSHLSSHTVSACHPHPAPVPAPTPVPASRPSFTKPKAAILPRPAIRCHSVRHAPYPAAHLHPHWRPW